MLKKSKNKSEVVVMTVDLNNEPVELQKIKPTFGGAGGFQIKWEPGVPNPSTDPEGFKSFLEAWYRKHNPNFFNNEEK